MQGQRYPWAQVGEIVAREHDWAPTFVLLPHRTISGQWAWLERVYVRRVWRLTGLTEEPFTEYATALDLLTDEAQI